MAADPLVGKVLADRFEILERIGEGGTGVVYKARQTTVDREVAIKVLGAHVSSDPQWVKRFQNEARAVAKLHHPNTVQLIDFGQTREGLLFIAMELLHGRPLRDEIDRLGKLPPQRALRIIAQACGSVGEAHSLNIIHRDIKPDNLYLVEMKGADDSVKVLDFSVAKMDTGDNQQTRAGVVFGTPAYMSPEQGRGAKLGPQSDIYGFGIVLYEMLSGKPPFDSKIPTEVVMMHLREKPKPLAGVPDPLNALVMRSLDKDPAKRQQSCSELAAGCEEVIAQLYPQHTPSSGPASARHAQVSDAPAQRGTAMAGGNAQRDPRAPGFDAGSQAARPRVAAGGPPPAATPPGTYGAPPPATGYAGQPAAGRPSAGAGQRGPAVGSTMIADAARPQAQRGGGSGTMLLDASGRPSQASAAGGVAGGTMILPDSEGVISFELARVEAARHAAALEQHVAPPARPVHWSWWAGWIVLGFGAGLGLHFLTIAR